MKKETLRFKGLLYLLTFVLLFGCKSKIDDYTKSLPDQAIFVVSVDVKNIVLKGGLSNFENPQIDNILEQGVSSETAKILKSILKNPEASGFSFAEPVYIFAEDNNGIGGALLKVKNEKDLTALIDALQKEGVVTSVSKDGDINTAMLNRGQIVYTPSRFIIASPMNGGDMTEALTTSVVELVKKDSDSAIKSQQGFSDFMSAKGDMKWWADYGKMLPSIMKSLNAITNNVQPITPNFEVNMNIVCTLKFEAGKILFNQQSYYCDEEAKQMLELSKNSIGKYKGIFMKNLPQETIMNMGVNIINFSSIMEYLEKINPEFKTIMDQASGIGVNMNEFMDSFNGDFIFDVENLAMGVPKMTLMAEVKNDYICETILKATEGLPVKFQKQEEGVYSLQGMVTMYNKDGKLIITTDPEVISNLSTGFNPSLEASECAKFYKNSYGAFFVDIKGILNSQLFSMLAQQAGQANIAKILLADFSYMAASNVSLTENNIEIAMVNTTDNSLKVIIDTVKKLVAMQN